MKRFLLMSLVALAAVSASAQGPAKGALLVATPEMRDPRFSETVVLLLHYESEGALGVAINRPTWVDPAAAFPDMDFLESYRGSIFVGGPVARANVLVLVRGPEIDVPDTDPIVDDVYLSADPEFLRGIAVTAATDDSLRLYAGHASWEGGQLDREIAAGRWQIVPASADLIFAQEPLELWRRALTLGSEMSVGLPVGDSAVATLR